MALEPIFQVEPRAAQDVGEQVTPVVDDDAHRGARRQVAARVREDVGHSLDVCPDRIAADAPGGTAELGLAPLVEAKQLIGVAVLLVVVDQTGYGGEVTTASNGPPRSSSRASPCWTDACAPSARTAAKLSIRSSVSSV